MPSCNTYRLTWVSLTLGVGYLFTAAPAKHSHCSLPWTRGISSPPPFLTSTWDSSSILRCEKGGGEEIPLVQGTLEVVKQEVARVDTNILGISELKWARMGKFNRDNYLIYY